MKKLSKVLALALTLAMIIGATLVTGVVSVSATEYVVWEGDVDMDFVTGANGYIALANDVINDAIRNDLATNGVYTGFKVESDATITNDPNGWGYFTWVLLEEIEEEGIYNEMWANDAGAVADFPIDHVNKDGSTSYLKNFGRKTQLFLASDGGDVTVHVGHLKLIASHEAGGETIATKPVPTVDPSIFTNKVQVWSGTVDKEFVTNGSGIAMLQIDEVNDAIRNDIATNGPVSAYLIESDGQWKSGPSGYAVFMMLEETESVYVEAWGVGPLSSCGIADAQLANLGNKAQIGLVSEGEGDVIYIGNMTIYAVHGGVIPTQPIVTQPVVTEPIVTEPIVTEPIVTEPIVTEPVVTEPIATETGAPTEAEPTETGAEPTETGAPTEAEPTETAAPTEAQPTETVAPTAAPTEAPSFLAGDANNDGVINMKDVLVLRKAIADIAVEMNAAAADYNADGAINMKDVLGLRKLIAAQ